MCSLIKDIEDNSSIALLYINLLSPSILFVHSRRKAWQPIRGSFNCHVTWRFVTVCQLIMFSDFLQNIYRYLKFVFSQSKVKVKFSLSRLWNTLQARIQKIFPGGGPTLSKKKPITHT